MLGLAATLSVALVAYRRRFTATLTTLAMLTTPLAATLSVALGAVSALPSQAHRRGMRSPAAARRHREGIIAESTGRSTVASV